MLKIESTTCETCLLVTIVRYRSPEQNTIYANMKRVNIGLNIVDYCVKSLFMWCCSELFRTPIPLLVLGLLTYPDCSRDIFFFFDGSTV